VNGSPAMGNANKGKAVPGRRVLRQTTLRSAIDCVGTGLHSGARTRVVFRPADPDTGIMFRRVDLPGLPIFPALWSAVEDTRLCSRLGPADGAHVATVEHAMAALAGLGVDNCLIEVDGSELPAMDGSADPFVFLFDCAGIVEQGAPRRAIQVLERIEIGAPGRRLVLSPGRGFSIDCRIAFDAAAISEQRLTFAMTPDGFRTEIARARTFGFARDIQALRAAGLARGGSLDNAVLVDGDRVVNRDGLRFPDEFVRHKILDAIGDLALAGAPLLAHVESDCAGHALNNRALRALFARPSAWRHVDLTEAVAETSDTCMRGAGARRIAG